MKVAILILLSLALAQLSQQKSGCVPGKCSQCSLNRMGDPSCHLCYFSITKTVDDDNVTCEGDIPIANCRYTVSKLIGSVRQYTCELCDLKFMPSDDEKSCVPTSVEKCLETISSPAPDNKFRKICVTCESGMIPNEDGSKCVEVRKVIENCLLYSTLRTDRVNPPQQYCILCTKGFYPLLDTIEKPITSKCLRTKNEEEKCLMRNDDQGTERCWKCNLIAGNWAVNAEHSGAETDQICEYDESTDERFKLKLAVKEPSPIKDFIRDYGMYLAIGGGVLLLLCLICCCCACSGKKQPKSNDDMYRSMISESSSSVRSTNSRR